MERRSSIGGKSLLDLPAEIRNRIYAAAITGEHYFPTLIAPRDANKRRFRTCVEDWHGSTRPLLCLTQVCRELRTEFRPIYMDHVHVLVSYAHIYEYLDLFVFEGKPSKDVKDPVCIVSLLVAEVDIPYYMDDNCDRVDLVPLLRLCKANPNIWFLVSMPGREEYAEQLQQMVQLNINDNESWWNFMEQAVSKIVLQAYRRTMSVDIMVKPEFGEEWMGAFGDTKRAWLHTRGLDWPNVSVNVKVDS